LTNPNFHPEPDEAENALVSPGVAVPQPTLHTERLELRPFYDTDADTVQHLLQCKEIAAFTRSIDHPYPDGAAKVWIGEHSANWKNGISAVFAICLKESPQSVMGAIGLELNSQDENAELGYWMGQPFWGHRYCTEAARKIVDFGFDHFGLKKIHAHHVARNPASGRVLQKIGMKKEGYLESHIKKWGVFEDVVFYGLVAAPDRRPNPPKETTGKQ